MPLDTSPRTTSLARAGASFPENQMKRRTLMQALPLSQHTDWFQTLENRVSGNSERSRIVHKPVYRAAMAAATFKAGEPQPVIEVTSHFRTRDRRVELKPGAGMQATAAELATYLKPTELMPTDGIVRAAGVPARDVYGIRVADSARGYKSLDKAGDITRAQHCRVEFHAQGSGWIPVGPADVRKVILEEKPNLTLADEVVREAKAMLWGGWKGDWRGDNYAHDVRLPGSAKAPVPFLMYPQAENAQGRLDALDAENFKYRITSRAPAS
jgi:hypothetical protein